MHVERLVQNRGQIEMRVIGRFAEIVARGVDDCGKDHPGRASTSDQLKPRKERHILVGDQQVVAG